MPMPHFDTRPAQPTPPGACDTHIHVYDPRYKLAPTAKLAAPDAPVTAYAKVMQRLALDRVVIVQPTAYGTDNRCTLEGMKFLGRTRARGVATIDENVTDTELDALTAAGIVGARLHMMPGGAIGWHQVDAVAARARDAGWHVQLQMDGRLFPDRERQIMAWTDAVVIDHVGKFLEPVPPEHKAFRSLLRMVESGRVWVKLSAAYEVSRTGAPHYEDVGRLARLLVKAAPQRMLWASNWPHPSVGDKPDDARLLDLLAEWVPDEKTRHLVLVDNPATLYGFN
jgi:D-galactarolactone isomerase